MKNILFIPLVLCYAISLAQPKFPQPSSDETGFVSIFDGTLKGWDGDPVYWSVDNGEMVGTITPETIVERNTFIIWRGGTPSDFELKVDVKVSEKGNSGINYRSVEFEKYRLRGYQMDPINGPAKIMKSRVEDFWHSEDRLAEKKMEKMLKPSGPWEIKMHSQHLSNPMTGMNITSLPKVT